MKALASACAEKELETQQNGKQVVESVIFIVSLNILLNEIVLLRFRIAAKKHHHE